MTNLPIWVSGVAIAAAVAAALSAVPPARADAANDEDSRRASRTYGQWTSSALGGGGYIQNVVPTSDPHRFYAYVDVAGSFRSDDGGRTWRMMHGNIDPRTPAVYYNRGLSVDPRDPDIVLIAVGDQWAGPDGIYRSTDAGESWTRVQQGGVFFGNADLRNAGFILERQPGNPDVILAGAAGRPLRSSDNGLTWQEVGPDDLKPSHILFDAADPDRVWLCSQETSRNVGGTSRSFVGGLFESRDAGRTWEKVADTAPREMVQDPQDPGILYGLIGVNRLARSTDGGRTWTDHMEGLPLDGRATGSIDAATSRAMTAGPDFVLIANGMGDFFRLQAGGDRWEKIEREGVEAPGWYGNVGGSGWVHFGKAAGSITVNPHDPQEWFFTDWYAIWRSNDEGRNWQLSVEGLEATVIHVVTPDPTDPGLVHMGMADNGYLRSTDGGATFEEIHTPVGGSNMKDIALSVSDPSRLYGVGNRRPGQWEAAALAISDDHGTTWRASELQGVPELGDAHRCNSITVHPGNRDHVLLAVSGEVRPGGGGAYRSTDGGRSFQWLGQGLPGGFFKHDIWAIGREIDLGPDGSAIAMSQTQGLVYRLPAGGDAWQRCNLGGSGQPFSVSADAQTPGRFYVALRRDGLYRTDDGGVTWSRAWEGDAFYVRADAANAGHLVLGTDNGVFLSRDGGQTMELLDRSLPNRYRPIPAIAGERVIAGTNGNGVFWMPLTDEAAGTVEATTAAVP